MNHTFIATFLLIALFLSACGNRQRNDSEIIYWSSNNTYEIKFADEVVQRWNAENAAHPVHNQPVPEGQSSEEVILAAVVGKTTPDIYSNMWQGDVEAYAQAGALVALDALPGFWEFIYERCDSAVVEEIRSLDGHIYQIPWKVNPIMLIYNTNEMRNIGFESPPQTYSEFIRAGAEFKSDTDGDGYVDRWVGYANVQVTWWQRFFDFYPLYLAASNGGSLVRGNEVMFDNAHAVTTFRFLRKLYENKYFAQERLDARQDPFLSGVIATRFTGPWEIAHAESFKPEGFDYAFSGIPVPDDHSGAAYTYGDPKNLVIFNTCPNPRKAWEFVKFLANRENDLRLLELTNQLPRRKNVFEDAQFAPYFAANPKMIPFAKQAQFVRGTDPCPVLKEVFDIISQEYEACVIYGVKSPENAVADAAQAVRLLLM